MMFGGTAIIPTHVRARRKSKVVVGAGDTNCGGIGCWYKPGALAQLCWSMLKLILLTKGMGTWLSSSLLSMLTVLGAVWYESMWLKCSAWPRFLLFNLWSRRGMGPWQTPVVPFPRKAPRNGTPSRTIGFTGRRRCWQGDRTSMPLTVFDSKGMSAIRRERIDAAVEAAGQRLAQPFEAWIAADPSRGGVRVLITGPPGFERTVAVAATKRPSASYSPPRAGA